MIDNSIDEAGLDLHFVEETYSKTGSVSYQPPFTNLLLLLLLLALLLLLFLLLLPTPPAFWFLTF